MGREREREKGWEAGKIDRDKELQRQTGRQTGKKCRVREG